MSPLEREAFVRHVKNVFPNGWQSGCILRLINELDSLHRLHSILLALARGIHTDKVDAQITMGLEEDKTLAEVVVPVLEREFSAESRDFDFYKSGEPVVGRGEDRITSQGGSTPPTGATPQPKETK